MNKNHKKQLERGVEYFNRWREKNPGMDVDLSGGDFSKMELDEADFTDALLHNSDFSGASLIGADFSRANISNSNLSNIDGRLARFEGTIASKANFTGANLSRAKLRMGYFDGADFTDANLNRASFRDSVLKGATFTGARAKKAQFTNVEINEGSIGRGELKGALLPKELRSRRSSGELTRMVFIFINILVIIAIILFTRKMYNNATRKYGSVGRVIGSYMSYSAGNYYMGCGKAKKAIEKYKLAIKQKPDEPIYYYRLAFAYGECDEYEKAEYCYKKFLKMKPDKKKIQEIQTMLSEKKRKNEE